MNINWTYSPNSLQTVRTFVETRDYRAIVPSGHAGRGVALSYRALAPGGAGFCYRICTGTSESRPTAHYSLLTANSTYTFSAKEKDIETGLSYFGSRYYSSDLSVWLSVDPMSDKYPSLSPFVYCANNPVKLVDPNGEWPIDRAKRFMKRYECTHFYSESDGSISVQYVMHNDNKSKDVVIRLKRFKMNFFEKAISKLQRPSENITKRQTHRGGIWGITNNSDAHPPGQDESTDIQINQVDLDPLQQFSVPQSHHYLDLPTSFSSSDEPTHDEEEPIRGTS